MIMEAGTSSGSVILNLQEIHTIIWVQNAAVMCTGSHPTMRWVVRQGVSRTPDLNPSQRPLYSAYVWALPKTKVHSKLSALSFHTPLREKLRTLV